jgi:hypothetical protein
MDMKLTTSADKELNTISALLYGVSGIGKTTSLKTLPVEGTLICCERSRGVGPLRHCDPPYSVIRFGNWEDVRKLYTAFALPDEIEDAKLKAKVKATRLLVIDSLSEISDLCAQHIVQVSRPELVKERTDGKRDTPENTYADKMTMEDYGLYQLRILNTIQFFAQLPVHVVFTCRERWTTDKLGNDRKGMPNLLGRQAPHECPAYFDEVLHMENFADEDGVQRRVWRTFETDEGYAKDSSGLLAPFEETDWTALFTKILTDTKGETK